MLQKTYTIDVLNKKRVINSGLVPQYYVENSHEAIISKEMFHKVQIELKQRASLRKNKSTTYSSKYVLSNLIFCKKCGKHYRRVQWRSNGNESINWRCKSRLLNGLKCCDAESISEKKLQNYVIRAINNMIGSRNELLEYLKNNVEEIFDFDVLGIDNIDKKWMSYKFV